MENIMKIIFFGSSKFVIPIIKILRKNFDLALVVTTEKNPTDPIPSYCIKSKVRYYVVTDFRDKQVLQELTELNAGVGVLASFGAILPQQVLNLFPHGIINIHPSLLPKYRGPTPVQTAILNGEKETGVSIIKLDSQIDHGPILGQEKEKILPQDSAQSLYERLFKKGGEILPNILNKYLNGSLKLIAQNHKNATFTKNLTRADGYIDISYNHKPMSSEKLQRMIRAYYPWPGVWTRLRQGCLLRRSGYEGRVGGQAKLKIIKFLPEKKIQVEGKKPVNYKDFLNGYPQIKQQLEKLLGQLV